MKFPPPFRDPLALLIAYVAVVSAASPTNGLPESEFSIASPLGPLPTFSGGSVNRVSGYTMNFQTDASDSR